MSEKWKPTHCLRSFKKAFSEPDSVEVTGSAIRGAMALGLGDFEMNEVIQTMEGKHFYKSMTSHANHKIWQDVYHVPSEFGELYIKFTEGEVTEFKLLSFKEKQDG